MIAKFKYLNSLLLPFIVLLVFLMSPVKASAETQDNTVKCQPYSITLDPIACGPGYTGVKFPLKVKTCPDGRITVGATFDTGNCRVAGEVKDPNATDCAITPLDPQCTAAPTPKGCPAGKYWVTTGSKIAHCVDVDPACPWGQSLNHDFLGNPYCVPNTCPSNQVLQGDGISCACASGLVWDGGACVSACSPSTVTQSAACSAGFTGSRYRDVTTTCPFGALVYSAWDTSSCTPNVVPCPSDTSTTSSCGAGFTGSRVTTTTYSGASCTPSTSTDSSGCVPIVVTPCPSDTSTTSSCGAGFTGSRVTTTTYSGASCTPSTSTDSSGCVPIVVTPCPSDTSTTSSCGAGFTGTRVTTTTYSGASCTPSSSTDSSGCVPIVTPCPATSVVTSACPLVTQTGSITTTTTYSGASCTPNIVVSNLCVDTPPSDVYTEAYVDFWSWDGGSGQPGQSCSFQVWLEKYKNGVKYAESQISYNAGYIDSTSTCILY